MPTYEYACTSCGLRFDVVQSFSEAPLETCEVCGGRLKRVFHPVGILLKGSGFYSTDNRGARRKGKEPAKGSEESKSAETKKDSAKKTDTGAASKPAEKKTGS